MSSALTSPQPLVGRVAVITGAASGIGEATARRLAELGAQVALLARREERLNTLAAEIGKSGGQALAISTDVTDAESVQAAADRVAAELGTTDLLVNSAGVWLAAPVADLRTDYWNVEIETNVRGLMNAIGAFTPHLIAAADAGRQADLVNVSSVGAWMAQPMAAVYTGTKAFVTQMSASLRNEFGAKGIRVSSIEPGLVAAESQSRIPDPALRDAIISALDVAMQPEDIAESVAFTVALPSRVNLQLIRVMPTKHV
ncbi:SDR family oxidoreductase [Streptomyces sp. NPDC091217]|uniref:SDR family oxidoreductase n=1 Tax=Streptomyces sp. NPDC091217 TaxID=3365975 RepID=UPI003815AEF1